MRKTNLIFTRKLNSFPGDRDIQLCRKTEQGFYPLFNISPETDRQGRYYSNDRYSAITFRNIAEAKFYAAGIVN